jgi:hypothetical protein
VKKHRRKHAVWKLVGVLCLVVGVCLFAPGLSPTHRDEIKDGAAISLFGCQDNPLAEVFGPSPAHGKPLLYWDCACTWWQPPTCSGTARRYENGVLVSSWFSSCNASGRDQDGNPCLGCCFRTDCTWIVTDNPPAINLSILCASPGANGWCTGGAQAEVTASDPDGDPISVSCADPTSSGTGITPLPDGAGAKSCTVTANGVSRSASTAWQVDTTNPAVSFSVSGTVGAGGWYTSAPTVTISGSDATSGVAAAVLSSGGSSITISSEGTTTVSGTVTDHAGNSSSQSIAVNFDATPPGVSISSSGCGSTITYRGTAADDNGVSDVSISVDGATYPASFGGGTWSYTASGLPSGVHSAAVTVTDTAGHTATARASVNGDAQRPTVSMGGSLTQHTATALTISDNHDLSKVRVGITVSHDGNLIFNQSYNGANYPGVLSWGVLVPSYQARYGEELTIHVRAEDACGNWGSASAVMVAVQPSATPTATPSPTASPPPTATRESKPVVVFTQPAPPQPLPSPTPTPTPEPQTAVAAVVGFWDWAWMLGLMLAFLVLAINRLGDPRPAAWGRLADVHKKKNNSKTNTEEH